MKSFNNFINENQKFQGYEIVKRKSDGAIGKIDFIYSYTTGVKGYLKYQINFGDGFDKYLAKELEKPTREERKLYFDIKKYNL